MAREEEEEEAQEAEEVSRLPRMKAISPRPPMPRAEEDGNAHEEFSETTWLRRWFIFQNARL